MSQGAATKNGHAIPTENGLAFDDGRPVGMSDFPYDEADREFAEQMKEIGRKEERTDQGNLIRESLDRVAMDDSPLLSIDSFHYACGMTALSEVEIADKHTELLRNRVRIVLKMAVKIGFLKETGKMDLSKAVALISGKEFTKQAVAKRAKDWKESLRIPKSASMRDDKAREAMKKAATESWSQQKQKLEQNQQIGRQVN